MDLQQSELAQLKRTLEAALLSSPEPIPVTDLRRLFDADYGAEVIRPSSMPSGRTIPTPH